MVAQWLAHLPLVLEVPGSIPAHGKENFGVRTRQCSPMAVGPSDISGNDWLGPINNSPAADRMSDEIFRANLVFLAEIWAWDPQKMPMCVLWDSQYFVKKWRKNKCLRFKRNSCIKSRIFTFDFAVRLPWNLFLESSSFYLRHTTSHKSIRKGKFPIFSDRDVLIHPSHTSTQ